MALNQGYYDSDEEIAWGPLNPKEIMNYIMENAKVSQRNSELITQSEIKKYLNQYSEIEGPSEYCTPNESLQSSSPSNGVNIPPVVEAGSSMSSLEVSSLDNFLNIPPQMVDAVSSTYSTALEESRLQTSSPNICENIPKNNEQVCSAAIERSSELCKNPMNYDDTILNIIRSAERDTQLDLDICSPELCQNTIILSSDEELEDGKKDSSSDSVLNDRVKKNDNSMEELEYSECIVEDHAITINSSVDESDLDDSMLEAIIKQEKKSLSNVIQTDGLSGVIELSGSSTDESEILTESDAASDESYLLDNNNYLEISKKSEEYTPAEKDQLLNELVRKFNEHSNISHHSVTTESISKQNDTFASEDIKGVEDDFASPVPSKSNLMKTTDEMIHLETEQSADAHLHSVINSISDNNAEFNDTVEEMEFLCAQASLLEYTPLKNTPYKSFTSTEFKTSQNNILLPSFDNVLNTSENKRNLFSTPNEKLKIPSPRNVVPGQKTPVYDSSKKQILNPVTNTMNITPKKDNKTNYFQTPRTIALQKNTVTKLPIPTSNKENTRKSPKYFKLPVTPNCKTFKKPNLQNVVSPLAVYINSPAMRIKRNIVPKEVNQLVPGKIVVNKEENIASTFPEVIYKPPQLTSVTSQKGIVVLPKNIEKLVTKSTVCKHDDRNKKTNMNASLISKKLRESELSIASISNNSTLNNDISYVTRKDMY